MRSIHADLTAAQKAASAEPYVSVQIQNVNSDATRLDFALVDSTANTISKHDAAIDDQDNLHRVRITGGTVYYQKSAATGPYTGAWTNMAAGKGTVCAIAAKGARVTIIYTDAADTGIKIRESTNRGTSFAAEAAVITLGAAALDLAATIKDNPGSDMAVAWVQGGGAAMGLVKRVAAVWGAATTSPTAASWSGVAMNYVLDWEIVLTGVETGTNKPSVWCTTYGDGGNKAANTWDTLHPQQQAESDATVTYKCPFLANDEVRRVRFVEVDAFSGGATRAYRSHVPVAQNWLADFNWRTPAPVNYTAAEGLAIAVGAGYAFEVANDAVYRATRNRVTLDASAGVLQCVLEEKHLAARGHVDIDNTDGAYAGPPSPIGLGNLVKIAFGYNTVSGQRSSPVQDVQIAGVEYRRTGGVSVIRLHLAGYFEQLARDRQRTSIFHAAAADTYRTIITRIFNRAGIYLSNGGSSSRAATVKPAFQIAPTTDALTALRQALAFITDRFVPQTVNTLQMIEPLASDTSDYTLGTSHAVYEAELLVSAPPTVEAQAFGAATFGEAIDYASAQAYLGTRHVQRDLTSAAPATAAATAAANLRQRQLEQPAGRIVCPPICGLELLDVIDITDELVQPGAVTKRVQGIRWLWDVFAGKYEQTLDLGAV